MKFFWFMLGLIVPFCLVSISYALPSTNCYVATDTRRGFDTGYRDGDQLNPNVWCPQYGFVWVTVGPNNWSYQYYCEQADDDCDGYPNDEDLCPTEGADATVYWKWNAFGSTGAEGSNVYASTTPNEACTEPEEPATCSDGLKTEGETGIDCGGDCSAECVQECPPDTTAAYVIVGTETTLASCDVFADPDQHGNCANLTDWTYDAAANKCYQSFDPVLVAGDITPPESGSTDPNTTSGTSVTTVEYSTMDNGDGTSTITKTTTTTTTNPDGSTSSLYEMSSTTVDTATGEVLGESSTSTSETDGASATTDSISYLAASNKKALEGVQGSIEDLAGGHDKIEDALNSLKETSDISLEDIEGAADTESSQSVDAAGSALIAEINSTKDDYISAPSTFPVAQTITDRIEALFPTSAACQDIVYSFGVQGGQKSFNISCDMFDKIRALLGFVFFFLTLLAAFDLVFNRPIAK